MPSDAQEISIVNAETIRGKIYFVRGQQVMLDFELAEIYGYETKDFNRQVKNNIEKFEDDFRFQLTQEEWDNLRWKKSTSSWGGRRYLPYVFTEQGIYMLMTVLRGDLATKQSKALIRLFKQMKDCLFQNQALLEAQIPLVLSEQVSENARAISELRSDLDETRETLSKFIAGFDQASFGKEYLILDGQTVEASVAYQKIYGCAHKSVYVVDNYLGLKTILHLAHVRPDIEITVFSDNVGKGLTQTDLVDYREEYPRRHIDFRRTGGKFHDRFIVLDYGEATERIFICGSSSKDSGKRVTVIMESGMPGIYHAVMDGLLSQPELRLR